MINNIPNPEYDLCNVCRFVPPVRSSIHYLNSIQHNRWHAVCWGCWNTPVTYLFMSHVLLSPPGNAVCVRKTAHPYKNHMVSRLKTDCTPEFMTARRHLVFRGSDALAKEMIVTTPAQSGMEHSMPWVNFAVRFGLNAPSTVISG